MRTTALIILSMFSIQTNITTLQIREAYFKSAESKDEAVRLNRLLDTIGENSSAVILCYKGAAEMLKAKYAFNPFTKMSFFNKGKELIERSIARDTSCIESRFVRFTIQCNLPGFLGYNKNIRSDSTMIANGLPGLTDNDLKSRINNYFKRLSGGIK